MTIESKPICLITAPVATRSGYGDMARDLVRWLIDYDKYEIKIISLPWGETPMNALNPDVKKDAIILEKFVPMPVTFKPDLYIHVGIPNEAQPVGKYNILYTAGIETTAVSGQWVEASNRMDLILTISEHSKNVFLTSKYTAQGPNGQPMGTIELQKPIEVLHNCIDQNIVKRVEYEFDLDKSVSEVMNTIPEKFCYLFVGHWMRGEFGEDRKNVGMLVKVFLETFKQIKTPPPALILKTSGGVFSILDKKEILRKIEGIRGTVELEEGQVMPNIYVLHGELTDSEMNSLYNHSKIKAHVSLTKGEGFGRPLLEASISGKPVIASGWSGHMDFLNSEEAILVGGELKPVHDSVVWENIIIKESSWFSADINQAANALAAVFTDYETFRKRARILGKENNRNFSYQALQTRTFALLDKYVPEFPKKMQLTLPKLKKIALPSIKKAE
jgi:glycosyltransferase involved in cell wall biosynthesis